MTLRRAARLSVIGRRLIRLIWLATFLGTLTSCAPRAQAIAAERHVRLPTWWAAWVSARNITLPEGADEVLDRAQAAGLNHIFVNVFYNGQALFKTRLVPMYDRVAPGFDPLGYLVPRAHERGIKVDAWFLVGRVGDDRGSPVLNAHPDWGLVGPDGETIPWLNFVHPEVRYFIRDLALETVNNYDVDGLHFDYVRFPDSQWGFDTYAAAAFRNEYGSDLNELRYGDLPAYGSFKGNRLSDPGTAEVIASFSDGAPAVMVNHYGSGQSIILNWDADERNVAADTEIMRRSISSLLKPGGQVYLFPPQPGAQDMYDRAAEWLRFLGWIPAEVSTENIRGLPPESVLVLSSVYSLDEATAEALAAFVHSGGGVIFIDGPTLSIDLPAIQAVTGMRSKSGYFSASALIMPVKESPILPVSGRQAAIESYQALDAKWKELRRKSIDALLEEVFTAVTKARPEVLFTVTVTSDQDQAANKYLQDWQVWLQHGYVDALIPRAYVSELSELPPVLEAWKPAIEEYSPRITFGLIAYNEKDPADAAKSVEQLRAEVQSVRQAGSAGLSVFDLARISDAQLAVLKGSAPEVSSKP